MVFDSFSQTRSKSAIIADSTILYHKSNLCTFKYRFTYCLRPMNSHVSRPLFSNAMSAGLVLYICTSLERTPVHSSCSSFPLHIASHPKKTHAPRRHLISHLLCGHDKVLRAPRIVRVDTRLFVAYIVRVVPSWIQTFVPENDFTPSAARGVFLGFFAVYVEFVFKQ